MHAVREAAVNDEYLVRAVDAPYDLRVKLKERGYRWRPAELPMGKVWWTISPDPDAVAMLPTETCLEHCVLPIARNGDNLTIAVADPYDVLLLDDLNILSGAKVRPMLSHPGAIKSALENVFQSERRKVDADSRNTMGMNTTALVTLEARIARTVRRMPSVAARSGLAPRTTR